MVLCSSAVSARHQRRPDRRRRPSLSRRVPGRIQPRQGHRDLSVAPHLGIVAAALVGIYFSYRVQRFLSLRRRISSPSRIRRGAASSGSRFLPASSSFSAASWSVSRRAGSSAVARKSRPTQPCCAPALPNKPASSCARWKRQCTWPAEAFPGKRVRNRSCSAST